MSKSHHIDWLDWLLTRGQQQIISGYRVSYNSVWPSRSGGGLMVKSRKKSFSIDQKPSGTINDNFITRAFLGPKSHPMVEKMIGQIVESELRARLK
jgi:hypothetical protein